MALRTKARALATLAKRGVQSERNARRQLETAYVRFTKERDPDRKEHAGRELIQSIFGKDALAEDSVR